MKKYFSALPAYLGGKRKLAPLIFALLDRHVPRSDWHDLTLVDPLLGGGSVSLFAKLHGFRVVCSDLALRSAPIGRAFIANGSVTLNRSDVMLLLREPDVTYPHVAEERYVPSVFSHEHAQLIDRVLWWATSDYFREPTRSLALVLLIKWMLRIQPMSMLRGTDARAAFSGDYDRVSPRRVGHYLGSLDLLRPAAWWRLAQEVNLGVLPGQGEAYREDAPTLLPRVASDVVYLDPPSPGTTSYEREYAVLDDLLEGERLEVSGFSKSTDLLTELFQACRDIPVWLISLNDAVLDLEELKELIRPHRPNIEAIQVPYRHLGSIALEVKNATNKEYIVLAREEHRLAEGWPSDPRPAGPAPPAPSQCQHHVGGAAGEAKREHPPRGRLPAAGGAAPSRGGGLFRDPGRPAARPQLRRRPESLPSALRPIRHQARLGRLRQTLCRLSSPCLPGTPRRSRLGLAPRS